MESDINIDIEEGEAPLVEVKVCTIYKNICTKSCTWTFLQKLCLFHEETRISKYSAEPKLSI